MRYSQELAHLIYCCAMLPGDGEPDGSPSDFYAADSRTAMEKEEIELIKRAKEDKEAFGQLYERYADRIYNYIYYRTSNTGRCRRFNGPRLYASHEAYSQLMNTRAFPFRPGCTVLPIIW
jgi:hypothetical protein